MSGNSILIKRVLRRLESIDAEIKNTSKKLETERKGT
jgi:hypothetical protein